MLRFETKCFLQCCKSRKSLSVQRKHAVWFGATVTGKKELTLPNLLQIKIHKKIGANYMDFGIFLLNDDDGSQLESIEMECQGKPECIARKIFQEWVLGKGKPLTWQTLVETLRDCELNVLADQIQEDKLL